MAEGAAIVLLKEKLAKFIGKEVLDADTTLLKITPERLVDCQLREIISHGKQLFLCFDDFSLRIHLLLFGSYTFDYLKKGKLSLSLAFENGTINFYSSHIKLIQEPLNKLLDFRIDVLGTLWNKVFVCDQLTSKSDDRICDVLLDQKVFSGLGNSSKNEILFREQVHPESKVSAIPKSTLNGIVDKARKFSLEYLNALRDERVVDMFKVHVKKACPLHGVLLVIKETGKLKRKSYFCKICQMLYM